jgi:hypothetical protein
MAHARIIRRSEFTPLDDFLEGKSSARGMRHVYYVFAFEYLKLWQTRGQDDRRLLA